MATPGVVFSISTDLEFRGRQLKALKPDANGVFTGIPLISQEFKWLSTADLTPLKLKSYGESATFALGNSTDFGFLPYLD